MVGIYGGEDEEHMRMSKTKEERNQPSVRSKMNLFLTCNSVSSPAAIGFGDHMCLTWHELEKLYVIILL
jgi:hypothetical protein